MKNPAVARVAIPYRGTEIEHANANTVSGIQRTPQVHRLDLGFNRWESSVRVIIIYM